MLSREAQNAGQEDLGSLMRAPSLAGVGNFHEESRALRVEVSRQGKALTRESWESPGPAHAGHGDGGRAGEGKGLIPLACQRPQEAQGGGSRWTGGQLGGSRPHSTDWVPHRTSPS